MSEKILTEKKRHKKHRKYWQDQEKYLEMKPRPIDTWTKKTIRKELRQYFNLQSFLRLNIVYFFFLIFFTEIGAVCYWETGEIIDLFLFPGIFIGFLLFFEGLLCWYNVKQWFGVPKLHMRNVVYLGDADKHHFDETNENIIVYGELGEDGEYHIYREKLVQKIFVPVSTDYEGPAATLVYQNDGNGEYILIYEPAQKFIKEGTEEEKIAKRNAKKNAKKKKTEADFNWAAVRIILLFLIFNALFMALMISAVKAEKGL